MGSIHDLPKISQEEDEKACMYAMQLSSFSVLPMTLNAVIELDVFEIIAGAGEGAELAPREIAAKLPTENPQAPAMLDRMLRLLASHSVLTCSVTKGEDGRPERRYGATPVSKYFTKDEDGLSFAALVIMNQDRVFLESWHRLKDSVLEGGIAFNMAHGVMAFDYHKKDPRFNKVFNEGMSGSSTILLRKILERYDGFKDVKVLVDVGGGIGTSLAVISSKYPHIKGINFDLPHVISEAPIIKGVEHVGGEMFDSVPSGDAIFMKWVPHDWSDEHCLKLFKNCWKALPDSGKVILVEGIVPTTGNDTQKAQNVIHGDLLMLTLNPGGKERTLEEFESLAKEAGFSGFKAVSEFAFLGVMEFYK